MDPPGIDPRRLALGSGNVRLTAPAKRKAPPARRGGEWFLKGPIPGHWLTKASTLSGRALKVALAVWCEAGIRRIRTVRLSAEMQRRFSICAQTCKRGLAALEQAGLVAVVRKPGQRPQITILDYHA